MWSDWQKAQAKIMHEKNRPENPENEWKLNNPLDEEWDTEEGDALDEDEAGGERRNHPLFKIAVVLIIMAFVALSYAWLPSIWTINFDFLKQDKTLSEDEIVRRCRPAVVNIQATGTGEAAGAGIQGTGFNLEPDGMIVTNRHVVAGASTVEVTFSDGQRLFSRDIDLLDGYDLAIIRLKGKSLPSLRVSDRMAEFGQSVTIIGNPRGFPGVSCRGEVKEYYKTDSGMQVFTIGVTVAPGSSGSPVLDEQGRLVGIVYAAGKIAVNGEEQDRAIAIPATALHH
jgi:S1-C subfamily serine protease